MKKILTVLLCFNGVLAIAQSNTAMQQVEEAPNWPFMLSTIGTTQITSGVLYDKVTSFSNFLTYNRTDNNVSSYEHFNQALSELYRASDYTRFISVQELKNRTAGSTDNNVVDVGIINTSYQKLNYNEKYPNDGGLLFQSGKFVPISGKPAYLTRTAVIISPLKEYIEGSSATFKFNTNLIFNNATSDLKNLVVDFGDGVNVTIISNGSILVPTKTMNYSTKGQKFIKFTATMINNTVVTTYGQIYFNYLPTNQTLAFEQLPCYENLKDKGLFTSTIPFQGYNENSGVFGKVEYTIFYHNNNGNTLKKLIKPIIIIDGFDPKDKRKVLDCDCENDPRCFLDNSIVSFSGNSYSRTFDATKHTSIEDMMTYEEFNINTGYNENTNLITKLRSLGYDVIIINPPTYTSVNQSGVPVTVDGGADYIERNAMSLISYIRSVKQTLVSNASNEKLIIVGPSMGGQISRYALAYMEKKYAETGLPEWQHNARLWISVDSPHLGANIPLAAQANVWFFGEKLNSEKAKARFNEELNSVAGKQQLISQFQHGLNTGYTDNSPFFTTYYNNLNTNGVNGSGGYPVSTANFRKIALINGSLNGTKVGTEGQTFLKMRGYIDLSFLFFNWTLTLLRINDMYMPASGQTATIFQGDGQNFNIGFDHWYINHPRYTLNATNNSIKGSLDVIPGGLFSAQKLIKEGVEEELGLAGVRNETQAFLPYHSFIPTFSALGHLQPNQNWGNALNSNLTCPTNRLTPFDSYFGIAQNTQHTSFTKESVAWLLKELAGQPQVPWFPLNPSDLAGPDKVCLNINTLYSFGNDCKVPGNASWTVNSNLQIMSSNGYSVTVRGIGNGPGIITATFQNGMTVVKNIWVGLPTFNLVRDSAQTEYCDTKYHYVNFIVDLTGRFATNLQFVYNLPNVTYTSIGNNKYTFKFPKAFAGYFNVTVMATNSCGNFLVDSYGEHYIGNCSSLSAAGRSESPDTVYMIYPNPTKEIVNIELRDKTQTPIMGSKIMAELYNMMGEIKGTVEIVNNIASINVSYLPRGIYVLKINIDGVIESHQVAIE